MYFLIEGEELLEKYDAIWNKVNADIRKRICKHVAIKKSNTKIKSYRDETTDFHNKETEKEMISHITEGIEVFLVTLMKNRLKVNIAMCF